MADLAKTQDLEGLARLIDPPAWLIDPPAWLEHDDLIKRAEGWERANRDRPDEDFVRMAQGRRADAAELVRMSLAKAEKAWGWVAAALELQAQAAVVLAITPQTVSAMAAFMTCAEILEKVKDHG